MLEIRSNRDLAGELGGFSCFTLGQATKCIDNHIKKQYSKLQPSEKEAFQVMEGKKTEDLAAIKKTMRNQLILSNISTWIGMALSVASIALFIFMMMNPLLVSGMLALGLCVGAATFTACIASLSYAMLADNLEEHIRDFLADYIQNRDEDETVSLLNQKTRET